VNAALRRLLRAHAWARPGGRARRLQLEQRAAGGPGAAAAPAGSAAGAAEQVENTNVPPAAGPMPLVVRTAAPAAGRSVRPRGLYKTRSGGCGARWPRITPRLENSTTRHPRADRQQPHPFSKQHADQSRTTCWPWSRTSRRLWIAASADQRARPTAPCAAKAQGRDAAAPGAAHPRGPAGCSVGRNHRQTTDQPSQARRGVFWFHAPRSARAASVILQELRSPCRRAGPAGRR